MMFLNRSLVVAFDKLYCKYHDNKDDKNMALLMNIQKSIKLIYSGSLGDSWLAYIKQCNRDNDRVKQRRTRVRRYIRGMVDTFGDDVYLVSLTFDDNSLGLLSAKTRCRYVREYLNRVSLDYFACIDFGKKSGREHYHAICSFSRSALGVDENKKKKYLSLLDKWPYGFMSLRKLNNTRKDITKSCAYAFKASNYAFKNADSEHRPFHKRGVEHWTVIRDSWDSVHSPF